MGERRLYTPMRSLMPIFLDSLCLLALPCSAPFLDNGWQLKFCCGPEIMFCGEECRLPAPHSASHARKHTRLRINMKEILNIIYRCLSVYVCPMQWSPRVSWDVGVVNISFCSPALVWSWPLVSWISEEGTRAQEVAATSTIDISKLTSTHLHSTNRSSNFYFIFAEHDTLYLTPAVIAIDKLNSNKSINNFCTGKKWFW